MRVILPLLQLVILFALSLSVVYPAGAKGETSTYRAGSQHWRAADGGFAGWTLTGVRLVPDGALQFDPNGAEPGSDPPGAYNGQNFYNGGSYFVGQALSPEMTVPFAFKQAIVSWNAATPAGSWLEVQVRARLAGRWTKWYNLGVWASDYATIQRHSVTGQGDADGTVSVDTLLLTDKKSPGADGYQIKLRLFSAGGATGPTVRNIWAAYSSDREKKSGATSTGNPALWNTRLDVPECSQMVYPDGGNVWCSPTSVSMVLGYWRSDTGPCEPRVRAAVDGVYDWVYDGHGNWPFNTAYAAAQTAGATPLEGYVAYFTSLEEVEQWVAAGVPVIASIAWGKGDLTNATVDSTNGHLLIVVGFDAAGNPIVNDPAAPTDDGVQRMYLRSEFESLWQAASGGAVYLIYPQGRSVPR